MTTRVSPGAGARGRGPQREARVEPGGRGVGGPACECERAPRGVRERARATAPRPGRSRLPWERAAAGVNHFLWKVCGRGASGAGGGGGGVELPPAGGPGRAEPPALRRHRDPASARPVSRGPRRAGSGLGV